MIAAWTKSITVDVGGAARSLGISNDDLKEILRDGRAANHFARAWAKQLYKGGKYCVKVLTKGGLKFQAAKDIGVGRSCNEKLLREAVSRYDFFVIFDVTKFPTIKTYSVTSSQVLQWIRDGELGVSGISRKQFLEMIGDA